MIHHLRYFNTKWHKFTSFSFQIWVCLFFFVLCALKGNIFKFLALGQMKMPPRALWTYYGHFPPKRLTEKMIKLGSLITKVKVSCSPIRLNLSLWEWTSNPGINGAGVWSWLHRFFISRWSLFHVLQSSNCSSRPHPNLKTVYIGKLKSILRIWIKQNYLKPPPPHIYLWYVIGCYVRARVLSRA